MSKKEPAKSSPPVLSALQWEQLQKYFEQLVDMAPKKRANALKEISALDPDLHAELEALLAHDEATRDIRGIINQAAAGVDGLSAAGLEGDPARPDINAWIGTTVDDYKIEALLGVGGFGAVYQAVQHHPVQRQVAIKVVKHGLSTEVAAQRFALERQALANLGHPAIAQVFDAGSTPDQRPYFVMELVEGEAISDYCANHKLNLEDRLRLFLRVCAGVQHAHQRGILHRDLKPSNLLVTTIDDEPMVKIIDFGIAKVLHGPLEDDTQLTEHRQILGTLEYMSPEQASFDALAVDVRSDIYSLGVVLYQLLTGRVPFSRADLDSNSLDEALWAVREKEVPRPSTKESESPSRHGEHSATVSGTKPPFAPRLLRGDLDWILLKALEKNKENRYNDVGSLSADIERHLNDLPIEAGPPSRIDRLRKLYRRHRAASWAGVVALTALLGSVAILAVSLNRVALERDRAFRAEEMAVSEATSAQRVSDFLVELFEGSDPELSEGREVPLREILDRGSRQMSELSSAEPETSTRLLTVLGRVYSSLGLYDDAAPLLEKAVSLFDGATASGTTDRDPELELAQVLMLQGKLVEAETLCRENLERARSTFGPRSAQTAAALSQLAEVRYRQGDVKHKALIEEALEIRRAVLPADDPLIAENLAALAQDAGILNDWYTAQQLYREAVDLLEAKLGPWTPRALRVRNKLVYALAHRRDAEEALPLAEQSIEAARRIYGDDHPAVGEAIANRGTVHYRATRDFAASLADFTAAQAVLEKTFEPSHQRVNDFRQRRGYALRALGRHDEALAVQKEVLQHKIAIHGEDNFLVKRQYFNVALAAQSGERHELAFEYLMRHIAYDPDVDWKDEFLNARPMHHMAISLTALGRFEEAEDLLQRARTLLTEHWSAEHWTTRDQVEKLVELYERWNKPEELAKWRAELERIQKANVELDATSPVPLPGK